MRYFCIVLANRHASILVVSHKIGPMLCGASSFSFSTGVTLPLLRKMSASFALRASVYVPFAAWVALAALAANGVISEGVATAGGGVLVAMSLALVLRIRCPHCGERAVMVEYGQSHLNRQCRKCGADLTKVRPSWRRP